MNDWELVDNVINNKPVDRVPVGFWFHFLDDAETGDAGEDPAIARRNFEGHRRYIEAFKPDLVKIMSDGFFFYPVPGGGRTLTGPSSLERIRPVGADHPWIKAQVELVRKVRELKRDTFYFYNVFSPLTTLRFMLGRGRLVEYLNTERQLVLPALDRMREGLSCLSCEVVKNGGADGLYLSVQNPDLNSLSSKYYVENFAKGEVDILERTNKLGGRSILHICGYGGVRNTLSLYNSYPAHIFSWAVSVEGVSLGQGRGLFGHRAVLGGFPNTDGSILQTGDKLGVEFYTKDILEESGRIGVILGADCTIPAPGTYDRLEWVRGEAGLVPGAFGL
ncbi:MAG: uroporphyrinogen decarboxylase [Deltaproteobacteria bacterium]|jgi:uroporphyrinogen decarboxylase|nr:uroporphyrinogen decarboxylase [Deltaproteobacteria bacterium]